MMLDQQERQIFNRLLQAAGYGSVALEVLSRRAREGDADPLRRFVFDTCAGMPELEDVDILAKFDAGLARLQVEPNDLLGAVARIRTMNIDLRPDAPPRSEQEVNLILGREREGV